MLYVPPIYPGWEGASSSSVSPYSVKLERAFSVQVIEGGEVGYLQHLENTITNVIIAAGAKLHGGGHGTLGAFAEVTFDYSWRRNEGFVQVYYTRQITNFQVLILCYEHYR